MGARTWQFLIFMEFNPYKGESVTCKLYAVAKKNYVYGISYLILSINEDWLAYITHLGCYQNLFLSDSNVFIKDQLNKLTYVKFSLGVW